MPKNLSKLLYFHCSKFQCFILKLGFGLSVVEEELDSSAEHWCEVVKHYYGEVADENNPEIDKDVDNCLETFPQTGFLPKQAAEDLLRGVVI
jgi:hypothetical protein